MTIAFHYSANKILKCFTRNFHITIFMIVVYEYFCGPPYIHKFSFKNQSRSPSLFYERTNGRKAKGG